MARAGKDDKRSKGIGTERGGTEQADNKHLETYERLMLLNQHCRAVADILDVLGAQGAMSRNESTYFRLMVEEVRASSSQCIVEGLDGIEVQLSARISKKRLALEKRLSNG